MPDETRSNVYKLFRATRVSPDTSIDPSEQVAFYDGGLGSRASVQAIRLKWWRRIYNFLGQTTGLGITQNIIDCYAEIIRVWQPGDRIYLFGFSRGAYTVRCVAGVLKYCGVPTAVACETSGRIRPLQRDLKSARRIASEAVKHVYQHGSSVKRDPHRAEREALAHRFRAKYCCGDTETSNTAPYFIGVWDTVGTLGAGSVVLSLLAGGLPGCCRRHRGPARARVRLAVPAAGGGLRARRAHGALCRALPALPGAGEPRALPHGLLRHPPALCGALRPARAGHRREPQEVRVRALARGPLQGARGCRRARSGPLQAGMVRRQSFRHRRQLSRDRIAPVRHRAGVDGGGGRQPSRADPHRSFAAAALSRRRRRAARRARGVRRGLARAGSCAARCCSSPPGTSAGGRAIAGFPTTRCCIPRCWSGSSGMPSRCTAI